MDEGVREGKKERGEREMKGESHAFECCQLESCAERRKTVEWEREGRLIMRGKWLYSRRPGSVLVF